MDPLNKFMEVDRWKEYFDKTGKDVFEVIKFAIKVTYRFHPAGLLSIDATSLNISLSGLTTDNEDNNDDFDEPIENSEVRQPKENIIGDGNNGECQEKRRIIKIKLKRPGENVQSSSSKEEEKLDNTEKDLSKKSSELDKNKKHQSVAARKADSQDQTKTKTDVQFPGPKDSERSEVVHPKENIVGDGNNRDYQGKRHVIRIKLKRPGENVRSSSPKEEEKLNNAKNDLAKNSSELDKNQKHRSIATRKADSQVQAKRKTGVQFSGPKKEEKFRHVNQDRSKYHVSGKEDHKLPSTNEKSPPEAIKNGREEIFKSPNQRQTKSFESSKNQMLPSTITQSPLQTMEAKFWDEAKTGERKLEASKRKLEHHYKNLDNERKKLRTLLKETRIPNKGVGGCGKYYRRPVVYLIRRTIA